MKVSRNVTVSLAALACAAAIGGATAISLVGQQPSRDTIVRQVSGDGGADGSPSAQASPTAAASAAAAATGPTQTSATTTRSQTVTEPAPTPDPAPVEPTLEPVAPPANSGGESGPPVGNQLPTGPTEYPCLPQEYGINPRCPLPAPTN